MEPEKTPKKKKMRCSMKGCNKKLSNTVCLLTCRCGLNFCDIHRMHESHNCNYDYKNLNDEKKKLCIENMKCISKKIIKI